MSIQDDIFDMHLFVDEYEKQTGDKSLKETWERIYSWAVECENEAEELRPIVNNIKESLILMFLNEDEALSKRVDRIEKQLKTKR